MPTMVELKEDFFEAKFINFNNDFKSREFEKTLNDNHYYEFFVRSNIFKFFQRI